MEGDITAEAGMNTGEAMDDLELIGLIDQEIEDARNYTENFIGIDRAENIDFYFRRPFGNEQDGRSQVVSSDVADTVDWLVPSLLKIFSSTDKVVEFSARKAEDVKGAEQSTLACNYVFYTQNDGFLRLYEWIQDGLLQKAGVFKYWWDTSYTVTEEMYQGLTEQDYQLLLNDKSVEIIDQSAMPSEMPYIDPQSGQQQMMPVTHYDCHIKRIKTNGQIKIECVPPEELKISSRARSANIQEAPFIVHETPKTKQQLISEGYEADIVDMLPVGESQNRNTQEAIARRQNSILMADDDISQQTVWVQECYYRIDQDGDGIAELRKVCKVGKELLSNEIIAEMPFASWCPKIIAHEFFGNCPADDVKDLQELKSAIWRQTMDSLYQSNVPRWSVVEGQVDLDSLLTARPGGAVIMNQPGAATPLIMPFVGQQTFPMIEYVDSVRENRTGVTRYNQGLDANSLNKTATGINIITNMSQQKVELYARIAAEVGLKNLFRGIVRLLAEHQQDAMMVRLNNEYVSIDPSAWRNEYDMTINVGLGTGNKDQQLMHLSQIAMSQAQIAMSPFGQLLVSPKEIYNSQAKIAENAGFKDPGQFWKDPGNAMPPAPPPPPQIMKDQADHQLAAEKERNRHAERMIELRLEAAKLGMPMQAMADLGMPDPIGLGLPQPPQQMPPPMNGQMPPPASPMPPPQGLM